MDPTRIVRYRCFQILATGKYCVQSSDIYTLPVSASQAAALDAQFMELLGEEAPNERDATYETLEEAIANHEADFRDEVLDQG